MPTLNLELQLKFLNELEAALTDALDRYAVDGPEKVAELKFVQGEVDHARKIVAARLMLDGDTARPQPKQAAEVSRRHEGFGEGAVA